MIDESPFAKLDAALPDPDLRLGYYFLAGILYHSGITDLVHLDRILTIIAQSEVLPLDPAEVIARFANAPDAVIPYTVPDGSTIQELPLHEISILPGGAEMSTASPLPEGTTLRCDRCQTRLTRIGRFPKDQRCPCGGTFQQIPDSELEGEGKGEGKDNEPKESR